MVNIKSGMHSSKVKELKGDGLKIDMDFNGLELKVSGDGCHLTIAKNCGLIRVVGDGCSVKVNLNDGKIEYKGDGGRIYLGPGSRSESVSYEGDGGRVTLKEKKIRQEKSALGSEKSRCCDRISHSDVGGGDAGLENRENDVNERRAAAKEKRKEESSGRLRRDKTIILTKISADDVPTLTTVNNNLINNWFRNPHSVMKSFKSGSSDSL
ncbi:uncharacterized protein LOC105685371 [Athalia rosae]|uniref:uncharacterized protein LOC105685371 n=1 Tax=Athalia rosae TaxID=37344 RepID=UPI002033FD2D|nr:uncharacterized protein LOC105685371 [Athalia rosae]